MSVYMMKKLALVLLTVFIVLGSVSSFAQKLYPVQGPLSKQTPAPVFAAKLKRPLFSFGSHASSSGSITWILANGERVQGTLVTKAVIASSPNAQGDTPAYPPQPNLAYVWDAVFGQGYYVANILGKKICQKILTGDQGTVLQAETYNPNFVSLLGNNTTRGVAADNKGNIFKLVY
jgi:hypothetical protein